MHPERYPLHIKTKGLILTRFQNIRKLRILLLKIEGYWSTLWIETQTDSFGVCLLDRFYHALQELDYYKAFTLSKQLETLWLTARYGGTL